MIKNLENKWMNLCGRYSQDIGLAKKLFGYIEAQYSQSNRYYHRLSHLYAIFRLGGDYNLLTSSFEFATWYHDVIYKPLSKKNEIKSANVAKEAMNLLGVDTQTQEKVINLILATQNHTSVAGKSSELSYFLDCDMAILATEREEYKAYVSDIRREYSILPMAVFRQGRKKFLLDRLNRSSIFESNLFLTSFELKARSNLEWEISTLS